MESIAWAECVIGDPRTISPETPVDFSTTYKLRSIPEKWTALIHYTDLGEALEYIMKLNEKGFSLVMADPPPGPIGKWLKAMGEKITNTITEMDGESRD